MSVANFEAVAVSPWWQVPHSIFGTVTYPGCLHTFHSREIRMHSRLLAIHHIIHGDMQVEDLRLLFKVEELVYFSEAVALPIS